MSGIDSELIENYEQNITNIKAKIVQLEREIKATKVLELKRKLHDKKANYQSVLCDLQRTHNKLVHYYDK